MLKFKELKIVKNNEILFITSKTGYNYSLEQLLIDVLLILAYNTNYLNGVEYIEIEKGKNKKIVYGIYWDKETSIYTLEYIDKLPSTKKEQLETFIRMLNMLSKHSNDIIKNYNYFEDMLVNPNIGTFYDFLFFDMEC